MAGRTLKSGALAGLLPLAGALTVEKAAKDQLAAEQGARECGGVEMTFEEYVVQFERGYRPGSEEYFRRQALFESRAEHISGHNCADEMWKAQVNHLTDWTEEELQGLRGYKRGVGTGTSAPTGAAAVSLDAEDDTDMPTAFSWGHLDAISTPTDQGQCGSCWAYAAGAALNAHAEINNNSHRYSFAQIVACTPNPQHCGGSGGCDGATVTLAYEYAMAAGLRLDVDFPSKPGGSQAECPVDLKAPSSLLSTGFASKAVLLPDGSEMHTLPDELRAGGAMGMQGWIQLPKNKEKPLVRALVEYGPIALAVAAGHEWNWYYHGILTPQGCDRNHVISHAVVLYGYGRAINEKYGEVKYWRIKNSWGRSWGEDGNIRVQRVDQEDSRCGWDEQPDVGSGCIGGPKRVWVCGSCGILFETVMPRFH